MNDKTPYPSLPFTEGTDLSTLYQTTSSHTLGSYSSHSKENDLRMVKCLLTAPDGRKKMIFFPEDKIVNELMQSIREEFGDNTLTIDEFEVHPETKLSYIATDDGTGKLIFRADFKAKS